MSQFYKGLNYFVLNNFAEGEEPICEVCGCKCTGQLSYGATSFVSAMAGIEKGHVAYTCPNSHKEWHKTALQLVLERNSFLSHSVRELIEKDINQIISDNLD